MANETIAQFPGAVALTGTELVPVWQAGATRQTALSNIIAEAVTAALAGISAPQGLTFSQLNQIYPTGVPGVQVAMTTDYGAAGWNPTNSTWELLSPVCLLQTAIPFILPSTPTMGNNGAFTLATALDTTYANCYMYFPPGAIVSGSQPGLYFTQMSSATAGVVYNNVYRGGQPSIPSSPTAFVTTGPGATTQILTSIVMSQANLPPFTGLNGQVEFTRTWSSNSSGGTKAVASILGGSNISGSDGETTAQWRSTRHLVTNRGTNQSQASMGSISGDVGTGVSIISSTADLSGSQTVGHNAQLQTNSTDWIVIQRQSIWFFPSGLRDSPGGYTPTPAGPTIVPPGAKALGYNVNKFFVTPTAATVGFGTDTTHQLYAGLWYQTQPPFATSYITTQNGQLCLNYLGDSVNALVCTQNQNSQAGALPLLTAANGFYVEWAETLSDNNHDHFNAVWLLPTEHNTVNGSAYPYVEIDCDEGGNSRDTNDPFYGSTMTTINWATGSGGSPTTLNNLSGPKFGPNIDRTQEHIFGVSYDPVGKVLQYWLDGVKQPFNVSTSSFDANIYSFHYYMIMNVASHGLSLPFTMQIRYFSAWSSV